jgi:hypothetical protein
MKCRVEMQRAGAFPAQRRDDEMAAAIGAAVIGEDGLRGTGSWECECHQGGNETREELSVQKAGHANHSAIIARPRRQARKITPAGSYATTSNFDLPAQFDDPIGRDAEELGGVERII